MLKHWNRLSREVVDASFNARLDGALGSLIWMWQPCPWQGHWKLVVFKLLSNQTILLFYDSAILQFSVLYYFVALPWGGNSFRISYLTVKYSSVLPFQPLKRRTQIKHSYKAGAFSLKGEVFLKDCFDEICIQNIIFFF